MEELFKDIKGYEGKYQISNFGKVISLEFHSTNESNELKYDIVRGYKRVSLSLECKVKRFLVHRLVAEHFIDNPFGFKFINHKDEDKLNNNIQNLEWCTSQYNVDYSLSKSILQYDLEGNLIKKWKSIREIGRNGFDRRAVHRCLNGTFKQHKGYVWRYEY